MIGSFICQALFQIYCVERPSNSHAKQIQFCFPKAERNTVGAKQRLERRFISSRDVGL